MGVLGSANIDLFKELMDKSTKEKSVYEVTTGFLENSVLVDSQLSKEQKTQILSNILSTITTQFTIQAMESSRSLAMDDLLFDLKREALELANEKAKEEIKLVIAQTEAAQKQVDLANAEIEFNEARTNLVKAQTESENERTKNIKRERYAMDDQLRIKEGEYLSNIVFGYAAGGVQVPENLQQTALNAISLITLRALQVI